MPSSVGRMAGTCPTALIAWICSGVIWAGRLLAVAHRGVDRLQPRLGVGQVGAELDHDRADGVAAGRRSWRDFLACRPTGHHRDQRGLGQRVQLGQVGAHRAAAHREHDVVQRRAGGLADGADALERPVLGGEPPRRGDLAVEDRVGGVEREGRGLVAQAPVESLDQCLGDAGRVGADAQRAVRSDAHRVAGRQLLGGLLGLADLRARRPLGPRRGHVAVVGVAATGCSAAAASRRSRRPASGGAWCTSRSGRRAGPRSGATPTAVARSPAGCCAAARRARTARGPGPAWAARCGGRGARCRTGRPRPTSTGPPS